MSKVPRRSCPSRKVYLCAACARRLEMRAIRDRIQALGHKVVSSWIDDTDEEGRASLAAFSAGEAGGREGMDARAIVRKAIRRDLDEILRCDVLVAFSEPPGSPHVSGGRFVEQGFALGLASLQNVTGREGPRLIVVGDCENIFQFHSGFVRMVDVENLISYLGDPVMPELG